MKRFPFRPSQDTILIGIKEIKVRSGWAIKGKMLAIQLLTLLNFSPRKSINSISVANFKSHRLNSFIVDQGFFEAIFFKVIFVVIFVVISEVIFFEAISAPPAPRLLGSSFYYHMYIIIVT